MAEWHSLAHIIAGEASTCSLTAMLAVAWVYSRNRQFTGWAGGTTPEARLIAQLWYAIPDPTGDAMYLFSADDLRLPEVQAVIIESGRGPPVVFKCADGLNLYAY